jgi:hypothetical protein
MSINKTLYLSEMRKLLQKARRRWMKENPDVEVYSINIWTDPAARASAVNFDTRRNSVAKVAAAKRFARHQRAHSLRMGDKKMAQLFELWEAIDRETNPAEFAFALLAETDHRSFDAKWGESKRCWRTLQPLLLKVRELAASTFADLKLHADAEVSVNSEKSWCDHRAPMVRRKLPGVRTTAKRSRLVH